MKATVAVLAVAAAMALGSVARGTTHAELQAVQEDGNPAWAAPEAIPMTNNPIVLRGVWLTPVDEWLSTNYVEGATSPSGGGQFQVFLQAVDEGDRGGTALFMSQRQRNGMEYSAGEWAAELDRVTRDPATGRPFRAGDIVEVTARAALHYGGKVNINESHRVEPEYDFDVALVRANAGLPKAEAVTLSDFVALAEDGSSVPIFDAARERGGEHWQGMRVRLDGVHLTFTNGWQSTGPFSARLCEIADDEGRVFNARHPLRDLGEAPKGSFSVVGVVNQENSTTSGYEILMQELGPSIRAEPGSGGVRIVSFDADYADGWVLTATDDLESGEWKPVDATPVLRVVVEDAGAAEGPRFYRLERRAAE